MLQDTYFINAKLLTYILIVECKSKQAASKGGYVEQKTRVHNMYLTSRKQYLRISTNYTIAIQRNQTKTS